MPAKFLEGVYEIIFGSLMCFGQRNYHKALFACSTILFLTLINTQAFEKVTRVGILLLYVCSAQVSQWFSSSNHYVVSPEIIVLFSMLMLVTLHTFKLAKPSL